MHRVNDLHNTNKIRDMSVFKLEAFLEVAIFLLQPNTCLFASTEKKVKVPGPRLWGMLNLLIGEVHVTGFPYINEMAICWFCVLLFNLQLLCVALKLIGAVRSWQIYNLLSFAVRLEAVLSAATQSSSSHFHFIPLHSQISSWKSSSVFSEVHRETDT